MPYDDNTLTNKLSPLVGTQLPEFIQADHPVFSQFVKLYYQFLESAEVTFSEVNNYIREETESVNFILDENGDQIVLEDSEVKFEVGETVTGQTSGATAKVLVDDVDDNKRLLSTNIRYRMRVPRIDNLLSPLLLTIPLQLLAYHVALLKNCDIDKPRNLAKSVTVE